MSGERARSSRGAAESGRDDGRGYRSVVLDCDSTLVSVEGIDELAGAHAAEIARLTDLAMAGQIPLDEVYGRRLSLIAPTRAQVDEVGDRYLATVVDDAHATVAALVWLGKDVRIVSGGLRPPVERLALALGLDGSAVAAVGISFDDEGRYLDFDRSSPLARNGGKAEVIAAWKLPRPVLLVGDGATDAEAAPAVDSFAAFTGFVSRQAVVDAADVVVRAPSLAPILALAADPDDRARLLASEFAGLLRRGDDLLGVTRPR